MLRGVRIIRRLLTVLRRYSILLKERWFIRSTAALFCYLQVPCFWFPGVSTIGLSSTRATFDVNLTGNMYLIRNASDRDARLFFAQARKVEKEELEEDSKVKASENQESNQRDSNEASRSPTLVPPPRKGR